MYSFQPIWLRIYITKRTSLEGEDQDEYLSRGPTLALNLFFFGKVEIISHVYLSLKVYYCIHLPVLTLYFISVF